MPDEIILKTFGSLDLISFSPIVSVEPRRRKFHRPIRLKIPLPSSYEPDLAGNLRLLCSITGGINKAQWEDVTGSTPLSVIDGCLVFTTTVSARFWLGHSVQSDYCPEIAHFGDEIWRQLIRVPYVAKFVIFAKRFDLDEANLRVFCTTDDADDERTLEHREHYQQVAKSREVEILDGQTLYLEFGGNLMPIRQHQHHASRASSKASLYGSRYWQTGAASSSFASPTTNHDQLALVFKAFEQNRLAFVVWLRDEHREPSGRIAFMRDSKQWLGSLNSQQRAYLLEQPAARLRQPVCTLGLVLPQVCVGSYQSNILGTPRRNSYHASARVGSLSLAQIASLLDQEPSQAYLLQLSEQRRQADQQLDDHYNGYERDSLLASPVSNEQQQQQPANRADVATRQVPGGSMAYAGWMALAPKLGIPRDEVELIAEHWPATVATTTEDDDLAGSPALGLLLHWYRLTEAELDAEHREQELGHALVELGRGDIAQRLEIYLKARASNLSRSSQELLRQIELIPMKSVENLYSNSELGTGPAPSGARSKSRSRSRFEDENQQHNIEDPTPDKRRPPSLKTGKLNY